MDYFNQQFKFDGATLINTDSLREFIIEWDPVAILQDAETDLWYIVLSSLDSVYAHMISVYFTNDSIDPGDSQPALTNITRIDIVSSNELADRLENAITAPSSTNLVGHLTSTRFYFYGVTGTPKYSLFNYYKYPTDPYFDYYTDSSGNVTYLTDGQSSYTLQSGEIARDGSTAGSGVVSASSDLEWGDQDAINILDMVVSDVSVALSDPSSFQASLLERKENVSS